MYSFCVSCKKTCVVQLSSHIRKKHKSDKKWYYESGYLCMYCKRYYIVAMKCDLYDNDYYDKEDIVEQK